MELKIMEPTAILIEQTVQKITAEGSHGSFMLLPEHIDGVFSLPAGIFSFENNTGEEVFLAIDEGILVKQGKTVLVSVRNGVQGDNLETLHRTVQEQFQQLDEQEKHARQMLARLESNFVREFLTIGSNQ